MALFVRDITDIGALDPTAKLVSAQEHGVVLDAREYIDAALAQADAIVAKARKAYEEECARGYAEGQEQACAQVAEQMIENVGRTVDYFATVEERMIDLVVQAMRRIIADFDERERVAIVVKGALGAVRSQKQVTLRVPTDRVELARASLNEVLAAYPVINYVEVQADPRLHGDACIVETEIGIVEASIDAQILALGAAFEKILGGRS